MMVDKRTSLAEQLEAARKEIAHYQRIAKESGDRRLRETEQLSSLITELKNTQHALAQAKADLERRVEERTADLQQVNRALQKEMAERKAAEDVVRESEVKFRNLVEISSDWIWEVNEQGVYTYSSPKVKDLLGYTQEEIIGRTPFDLMPPDEGRRVADIFERGRDAQGPITLLENRNIHKDGHLVILETSCVPLFDDQGAFTGYRGVDRDITERKRAAEALRSTNALLERIFATTHLMIAFLDRNFNFIRVNAAYAAVDDKRPDYFKGKNHFDLYPHEENKVLFEKVRESGEPLHVLAKPFAYAVHPERGVTYWDWSLFPVKDASGNVDGLLLTVLNVTDRIQATESLKRSEARYRELVENVPIWIWETDSTGRHVYTNSFVTAYLGYEPDEFLHIDMLSLIHPDDREVAAETVRRAMTNRTRWTGLVLRWRHKDGSWKYIESRGAPTVDPSGRVIGLHGVDQDITDRKQFEAALQDSEERMRLIIQSIVEGVVLQDVSGAIIVSNPSAERILGLTEQQMLGRTSLDPRWRAVHEDGTPFAGERHPAMVTLRTGEPQYNVTMGVHKPEGTLTWISVNTQPLNKQPGSKPYAVVATFRDITESRRIAETLRNREAVLRESQAAALIGTYVFQTTTGTWECTEVLDQIFGINADYPKDVPGWTALVHPDDREEMTDYFRDQVLGAGITFNREYRIIRRTDGQVRWVHGLGRLDLDERGKPIRMIGTIQDITERKKAEREKLELERRLLHAQKLESLGVLAGGIAHDFNNLLMAIQGNLELSLRKMSSLSPAQEYIEHSLNAVKRSVDLTRQMLAYSGKATVLIKNLDLSELVTENVDLLRASIPKNVSLQVNAEQRLPAIEADAAQLQQVVMNLITNAAESLGDEGGLITLSTGDCKADAGYLRTSRLEEVPPAGRYVYLEVSDSGCGMNEDTLRRLFEPFFTTKTMGRGLGMSAILGIVRAHKGAIMVDSAVGKGTTIRVLFPAGGQPAERVLDQGRATVDGEQAAAADRRKTVLIVDDEEMVRNVCSAMVRELGLDVMVAEDGLKALELLRKNGTSIDCVLLDLSMPKMDGFTVSREMRLIQPDVRIILSSGYHEQELERKNAGAVASLFIQKPYKIESLEDVLRQALKH
jgi:PAS domain S-box-containing protein